MPTIAAIASSDDRFEVLLQALAFVDAEIPGSNLIATLSAPSADLTVFAPTDAAFGQLARDLGFAGNAADATAVAGFLTASLPAATLRDVILYHVSAGAQTAAQITANGGVTTLLGPDITADLPVLVDAEPDLIDPSVVQANVAASNGVVHVIDRVLLPIDLPGNDAPTITGLVAASSGTPDTNRQDFDILLQAVLAAGLAGALDDPGADLTVFAPNDAAFLRLAESLGFDSHDETGAFEYLADALSLLSGGGDPIPLLTKILTYHVAPDSLQASQVLASTRIDTLAGPDLGVSRGRLVDAEPDNGNISFVTTDLQAANGIVHVINKVLLPLDVPDFGGRNGDEIIIGGAGDDVISGRGGRDLIDGNAGDDAIRGGKGGDLIQGGAGDDVLSGGRSMDMLLGGDDDDLLSGGRGWDRVTGGTGADTLAGGAGRDTFVFATGDGIDRVIDFEKGDRIDLSGTGIASFAALQPLIASGPQGAELRLAPGDIITLEGVKASSLGDGDFLFA